MIKKLMILLPMVALDQAIKVLIHKYYSGNSLPILSEILHFSPVHNSDMSWAGSIGLAVFANFHVAVSMSLAMLIVTVFLYRYICLHTKIKGGLTQTIFIFLLSGILCSAIDRIFWKGSLDYLQLVGFFTFDLKDCYITMFQFLLVYSCIRYRVLWREFNFKRLFTGYYKAE